MKVQHVITSMGANWGGPAVTSLLALRGIRALGIEATILTYDAAANDRMVAGDSFIRRLPTLSPLCRTLGYSTAMKAALAKAEADLYHIQGLWQYPGYAAVKVAQRRHVPYVITLHGQLYPQALAYHTGRKRLVLSLFQRRQLEEASCIQATCMEEYRLYRALGFDNPVAVIPNPLPITPQARPSLADGVKRIGFVGRFHPIKRIDRLIETWARIEADNTELVLIGEGSAAYRKQLSDMARRLGIGNIRFTGFVCGKEKEELLASLFGLVLPSDSENFGMVVGEALLQGVPVIASTGTPWEELDTHQCGWWVKNDTDSLLAALKQMLALDDATRREMGLRGRSLIEKHYSIPSVARRIEQMYDWVCGKGCKPDFIFTDNRTGA